MFVSSYGKNTFLWKTIHGVSDRVKLAMLLYVYFAYLFRFSSHVQFSKIYIVPFMQAGPPANSGEASPTFGHAMQIFLCLQTVYGMESISKEINNDNDLNLHSMT